MDRWGGEKRGGHQPKQTLSVALNASLIKLDRHLQGLLVNLQDYVSKF
jgi:hypothetical protein